MADEIQRAIGRLEGNLEAVNAQLKLMHDDVKVIMARPCRQQERIEKLEETSRTAKSAWTVITALGAGIISVLSVVIQWVR